MPHTNITAHITLLAQLEHDDIEAVA